jgi:adenine/guanine phosphoribosyltransferase-like PRPP-binding protein
MKMEVTLEKIELVKDRTGVTYKEAKEALEAADGNVVDAIVSIEDKTDGETSSQKISQKGNEIIDKIKDVVNRGNASRIIISRDGDKLLNLPLNAGVIGAIVAPWGIILGVAASFGFNCKIEVVKDDGTVVDITDKAGNLYEQAKEKGTEVYEQAVTKGNEVIETVKEKAPNVVDTVKEATDGAVNMAKGAAEKITGKKEETEDVVSEAVDEAAEAVEEAKDEAVETVEDIVEEAAEEAPVEAPEEVPEKEDEE